jgi:NADH dehydrogenase (ubiquinone) 1 beta subcomplex subunit 8
LHEEDEALNMFSPDLPQPEVEPSSALAQATLAFAVLGSIMGILAYTRPTMPAERRSFPHDGLVNELGGWEANKVSLAFDLIQYVRVTKTNHRQKQNH